METVGDKQVITAADYEYLINDDNNPMTNEEMDTCLKKHNITIPTLHTLKKGKQNSLKGKNLLPPPPPRPSKYANILGGEFLNLSRNMEKQTVPAPPSKITESVNQVPTPNDVDPRALSLDSNARVFNSIIDKDLGKKSRKHKSKGSIRRKVRRSNKHKANRSKK
jgi:hypothetical protein